MKKCKLLLILALVVVLALGVLVSCKDDECAHETYGAWKITTAPTLTTDGEAIRVCSNCGVAATTTVAKLSDTSVWTVDDTAADKTVYTSTDYGTVTIAKAPQSGTECTHTYGAWAMTVQPTLTTDGSAVHICSKCNHAETTTVKKLSDTTVWTASASTATHVAAGEITYTSTNFDTVKVFVDRLTDHVYTEVAEAKYLVSAADCEHAAVYRKSCVCGAVDVATFTSGEALGHDAKPVDAVVAVHNATTLKNAVAAHHKCDRCGKLFTDAACEHETTLAALTTVTAHSFGGWTLVKAPTCTEEGSITHACSICDKVETNVIPAHDHDYPSNRWAPVDPDDDNPFEGGDYSDGEDYDVPMSTTHARVCDICKMIDKDNAVAHDYTGATETFTIAANKTIESHVDCIVCGHTGEGPTKITGVITEYKPVAAESKAATYVEAGYTTYVKEGTDIKFKVVEPKFIAPYEGKTYTALELSHKDGVAAGATSQYHWSTPIEISNVGTATGTAVPFRGEVVITMVNPETGAITVKVDDDTLKGFIEPITGIMVISDDGFDSIYIVSHYDMTMNSAVGSYWNGAIAASYHIDCGTYLGHDVGIFVYDEQVHFGVSFVNADGAAVAVSECHSQDVLVVTSANGGEIATFVKNGKGALQLSDDYRGTYKAIMDIDGETDVEVGTIVLDGIGGFVLQVPEEDDMVGTYEAVLNNGALDYADVYVIAANGVKVEHHHATVNGNTIKIVPQQVTITLNVGDHGTVEKNEVQVFTNCVVTLPTVTANAGYEFIGWFTADGTDDDWGDQITAETIMTEDDVWYAKVVPAVHVGIVDSVGGNETLVYGVGDTVVSRLPKYVAGETTNEDKTKYFVGWFTDEGMINALDSDATISASDDNTLSVYAKWVDIPVWAGDYYGTEIWSLNAGNTSKEHIKISYDGTVSGDFTGTFKSYDAATQALTLTIGGKDCVAHLDAEAGIIAKHYNDWTSGIDNDINVYVSSLTNTNYKLTASYGIPVPKTPESTVLGYYLQLIVTNTKLGENTAVAFYNNHIYSNIVLEDVDGNSLTVPTVKDSSTLIIKSAKTNKILLAVGAPSGKKISEATTSSGKNCVFLDEYYGTYTAEGDLSVILDGAGTIKIGAKSGTYTKTDGGFDVNIMTDGVVTEFYTMTLDKTAGTCVLTKPMVDVHFVVPQGRDAVSDRSVNKNAAMGTLPVSTGTIEGNNAIFIGWYTKDGASDDWGVLVDVNTVVTEETTFYARWQVPHALMGVWKGYKAAYHSFSDAVIVTVDPLGNVMSTNSTLNGTTVIVGNQDAVSLIKSSSTYLASYDKVSGLLAIGGNATSLGSTPFVLSKVANADVETSHNKVFLAKWTDHWLDSFTIGGETKIFAIDGTRIYSNPTVVAVDKKGVAVEGTNYLTLGTQIAVTYGETTETLVYKGTDSDFIVPDGNRGVYTDATRGDVILDGAGNIWIGTENAITGKYTVAEAGKFTTTISGVYYEIAVNSADDTCTVTAPQASVTYVLTNGTIEGNTTVNVGIKVEFTLPAVTPAAGYQFIGWYTEDTYTNAVTKYTLTSTEAKSFYAKIEEMPKWSSWETTQQELTFENSTATFNGETTQLNQTYYVKFVVAEDGVYYLQLEATKVGGTDFASNYFAILDSTGNAVSGMSDQSYSSGKNGPYKLSAGTYYFQTSLARKVAGASTSSYKDCWGTFTMHITKALHSTADDAIAYTLGSTITTSPSKVGTAAINEVYALQLEAGKYYDINCKADGYSQVYLYSNKYLTASVKVYINGAPNSYVNNSSSNKDVTGQYKISTTGTYYLVTSQIVAISVSEAEPPVNDLIGKTFSKEEYVWGDTATYTVKFDAAADKNTETTTSGTITLEGKDDYGDESSYITDESYTFTATIDKEAKTVTISVSGKADIVVAYTDTQLKFTDSSISSFKNKTLNLK